MVSKLKSDFAEIPTHLHIEDVAVLKGLGAAGAARELDQGFVAVEEGEARQLGRLRSQSKKQTCQPLR